MIEYIYVVQLLAAAMGALNLIGGIRIILKGGDTKLASKHMLIGMFYGFSSIFIGFVGLYMLK